MHVVASWEQLRCAPHARLASQNILIRSAHSPSTNCGHTQARHAASGLADFRCQILLESFSSYQWDSGCVQCANVLLLYVHHDNVKLTFSLETTGPTTHHRVHVGAPDAPNDVLDVRTVLVDTLCVIEQIEAREALLNLFWRRR